MPTGESNGPDQSMHGVVKAVHGRVPEQVLKNEDGDGNDAGTSTSTRTARARCYCGSFNRIVNV